MIFKYFDLWINHWYLPVGHTSSKVKFYKMSFDDRCHMDTSSMSSKIQNNSDQNFTIHIKNFGPVSSAKIILKSLTVFVGPNNSGKSYTAMLIHSIISSYRDDLRYPFYRQRSMSDEPYQLLEQLENKIKAKTTTPIILDSEINEFAKILINGIKKNIPKQIQRNFNSDLKDVVRINSAAFKINMPRSGISVEYEDGSCNITHPDLTLKAKVISQKHKRNVDTYVDVDGSITFITPMGPRPYVLLSLFDKLQSVADSKILGPIPVYSHYLPAARSGILQGHNAITASVIRGAPYAGIEGTQIPPLSGVTADFISSIITMPREKSNLSKYVEGLDSDILDGSITVSLDKHRLPQIKYKFMNQEIPLHRTSSTVSELAPFVLYLKHIVGKNSLLIVEEPEAHLHPANQLILARYIARLVRAGLKILITTHSHFILEQLSILLQASNADSETRKAMGLKNDEYLNENDVSTYLFTKIERGNHTAEPIECSATDGISQEDFVKVQQTLYDQTIRVEQDIF